jgi:hypothetical protein
MLSVKTTQEFGGGGGNPFEMEYPNSLGVRAEGYVDALILNGINHGGGGGNGLPEQELGDGDYWSEFEVHSAKYVDWLRIRSKNGLELSGGGTGGEKRVAVQGARILRIGGAGEGYLDRIKIEYIQNYQPSTTIDDDAQAVLDCRPGGQKITTYRDEKVATAQAYERITEQSLEFTFNTSAEGEFYGKFSASTGLKTTNSTKTDIKTSSKQALNTGQIFEETLGPDEAAFLIARIHIMQDSDGHYWVYPPLPPTWTKLPTSQFKNLVGYFDFTSGTTTQTGLGHKKQYGMDVLT